MKESIVFYKSFYDSIKKLPKKYQLETYDAIFQKYFYGNDTELSAVSQSIITLMIPNINSSNARYFASVENGKRGGRPKKNENPKKPNNNLDKTHQNLNENVNDNENVNVEGEYIIAPTLDEIIIYAKELGKDDKDYCTRFYENYQSKGWKDITDWKAKFRYWLIKDEEEKKETSIYQVGSTKGLPKL